jgi:ADP-heptose:LPS heptosyltransferase
MPGRAARWLWALGLRLRGQWPKRVISFDGGLGDHLLCTTVVHELQRRSLGPVWVMSPHEVLFQHNPDIAAVVPVEQRIHWLIQRFRIPRPSLNYVEHLPAERRDRPPVRHILAEMCARAGLHGVVELRPYLQLTPAERAAGRRVERQVAIQSTCLAARFPMVTKDWYPERFQEVVSRLTPEFQFVQLGLPSDPPLAGALDLRGKTTHRETAAILASSLGFVGLVGYLMHLARAVECRSVIVYGGRELPEQTGYVANENLVSRVACAPCWRYDDCELKRECMQQISVDLVVESLRRVVARAGQPLETSTANLESLLGRTEAP